MNRGDHQAMHYEERTPDHQPWQNDYRKQNLTTKSKIHDNKVILIEEN